MLRQSQKRVLAVTLLIGVSSIWTCALFSTTSVVLLNFYTTNLREASPSVDNGRIYPFILVHIKKTETFVNVIIVDFKLLILCCFFK